MKKLIRIISIVTALLTISGVVLLLAGQLPKEPFLPAVIGLGMVCVILTATDWKNDASAKKAKLQAGTPATNFSKKGEAWRDDLQKGLRKTNDTPSGQVYDWKLKETWEDYPSPNYDDIHTYCQVRLDGSDAALYYRTRNPNLAVGDKVYVPVGRHNQKCAGRIISMGDYIGHNAPYPLEKTKFIIEKAEENVPSQLTK